MGTGEASMHEETTTAIVNEADMAPLELLQRASNFVQMSLKARAHKAKSITGAQAQLKKARANIKKAASEQTKAEAQHVKLKKIVHKDGKKAAAKKKNAKKKGMLAKAKDIAE